jgi:hypothetical protein
LLTFVRVGKTHANWAYRLIPVISVWELREASMQRSRHWSYSLHLCGSLLAAVSLLYYITRPAFAQATYYIDESTDFTGNGCPNKDLNDVTSSLRSSLNGWTGSRFVNSAAWPQDFIESCSSSFGTGGLDQFFADSATLSVYAGHGNRGLLQFGFRRNNTCFVDFSANMRLGSMAGAHSVFAMWVTSCTLNTDSLVAEANFQWERQQFGYHNSPSVKDDQPRSFYNRTLASNNKNAWLNEMEDKPGWFTGDNSPIVVTYGSTQPECASFHNNSLGLRALIRTGQINDPGIRRGGGPTCQQGQPFFWFCWTLRDNGGC